MTVETAKPPIVAPGPRSASTERVLWYGDAIAHTGFGTVTRNLVRALLEKGYDVRLVSDNETGAPPPEPFAARTWSANIGRPDLAISGDLYSDRWKPDAVMLLGDFAMVRTMVMIPDFRPAFASVRTFHYVPIEGIGLPPRWAEMWSFVAPLAMSRFGADQIELVMGTRPPIVPHGVDTDSFFPLSAQRPARLGDRIIPSKFAAKQLFHLEPDRLMMLRTDRLMPRKGYQAMLRALEPVMADNPRVDLVLHCRIRDQGGDLLDALSKWPLELRQRVKLTMAHNSYAGLATPVLNVLYNAADLYLSTSAEGFGLTIAEALACGVPAVGLDYSSVPEVIGPAGVLVPYALIDNEYDHLWATVDEPAFAAAVARLLEKHHEREELGKLGPGHIAANFTWQHAIDALVPVLEGTLTP